jgi:hypothetical protein
VKQEDKFGVEIEINAFDNRDFIKNPLQKGEFPKGIDEIVDLISSLGLKAEKQPWGYNHNNFNWICKPDASCGIEVCSPIFDFDDFSQLLEVVCAFDKDPRIITDHRCSFHVHLDVGCVGGDIYASGHLCSLLAWWIKCEHIFIDFACSHRKTNRYCRFIGKTELFDHEEKVMLYRALSKLSDKYLTLNTYHLFNKKRSTVEFRLGEGTKDITFVKNWLLILKSFSQATRHNSCPNNYRWIEPEHFFDFLKLDQDLLKWFLERLIMNCEKTEPIGNYNLSVYHEIFRKNFG